MFIRILRGGENANTFKNIEMKTTIFQTLFILSITVFSNCQSVQRARKIKSDLLRSATEAQILKHPTGDSIRLQYIGCGGFLIRHGNDAVLIDPYFSNADALKKVGKTLESDTALIDSFFIKNFKKARDTEGVIQTILISHAHHDHLADLSSLLKRNLLTSKVTLIGSETMSNLIQSFKLPLDAQHQIISFDSILNKKNPFARYRSPNNRVVITALKTEHAPHILRMKLPFIGGNINSIPAQPPRTVLDYKEGVDYNYIIDFLKPDGSIGFRIFSNAGAAANAPIGFPPPSVLQEKKVDILLLCGANYNQVNGYPDEIVKFMQPEKIFVAHWEDFFTPIPQLFKKPRVVPLTNIPKFVKILKKSMVKNQIEPKPIIVQPLTALWIKF